MQVSLKASYHCNTSGQWEHLNTESCPYISHTTKILEQFSKVNLSLTKGSLLETAKRFKNYTGNGSVKLTDPVEIHFIVRTIENYLNFLVDEKELGIMLVDIISSMMKLSKEMLRRAEVNFKACSRLIKAIERITDFTPSIQSHKRYMALEEFRVKRESFGGLTCTWYTTNVVADSADADARLLHCTTINRTTPINAKDKTIEASIQLPASLLQHQDGAVAHQLMISMYSDSRFFPKTVVNDSMDISTCVVGSKLSKPKAIIHGESARALYHLTCINFSCSWSVGTESLRAGLRYVEGAVVSLQREKTETGSMGRNVEQRGSLDQRRMSLNESVEQSDSLPLRQAGVLRTLAGSLAFRCGRKQVENFSSYIFLIFSLFCSHILLLHIYK